MSNTEVYYSGILLKSGRKLINSINLTNEEVLNFCLENQGMQVIGHNAFAVNGSINLNLF